MTRIAYSILAHVTQWGSDGYGAYVTKIKRSWHVLDCPLVFRTKREATAQFEAQLDAIRDRHAGRI